jgi:ribosome-binding factor A
MGEQEAKESALAGIESAAKFLRRELRGRLTMRYVPFLRFALDDSLEHADRLMGIINQIQESQIGSVGAEITAVEDSQSSPASTNGS